MAPPSIEHEWEKWLLGLSFGGSYEEQEHRDTFYAGYLSCLARFSELFDNPDLTKQEVALLIVDSWNKWIPESPR